MSDHPSSDNLVGKIIFGEYTITSKLGEGGMGAVYLATQPQIEQQVAIKVLHGRAARNDELVQRFFREAKTVTMLSHPNIIRVFIFGRTEEGLIYLAMEYVKGISLRDELQTCGRMSEMRAIKILKQTLSALAEAHTIGIIHRALKPDNIMLTSYRGEDDFVKLLDFGIAKIKDPTGQQRQLTQAGVVYGTPEYLSPEQAQALELDHRSDIYSLGCILYEMVTGHVPFTAPKTVNILMMHVYETAPPPSTKFPTISKEMEEIIL
jgi:serine/threonine-protein kinase